MKRVLLVLVLVLGLAALAAFGLHLALSADALYALQERLNHTRYAQYDGLIETAARKHGLEPMLIKALVWRESKFHPDKVGTSGERGLMQVGEAAAKDWAKAEKIDTFAPTDLFDPKVNLDAGAWYLARAASHWKERDDPLPFTLAEYNAGRTRVDRWLKETGHPETATAAEFLQWIDFPTTRKYIDDIIARERIYQKRGRL